MRRIAALALAFAVSAALAVPAVASTKTIPWSVGYTKTISIKKGSSVKWSWGGNHNVVSGSSVLSSRSGYTKKFSRKGTFSFYCSIHGKSVQRVTVKVS